MGDTRKPPFASVDADNLACPLCGHSPVQVRAQDSYNHESNVDAFCHNDDCHALLSVVAYVQVTFECVEVDDGQ